jgi:2-polyprenyl-6-methoxyphenol hydroxylase-like FAD-dependent oxidoreductase
MSTQPLAHVCGGGIAGLSAAASLAKHGWSVVVHERADDLRAAGGGITLWRNGLDALRDLGVFDAATDGGEPLKGWAMLDKYGGALRRRAAAADRGVDAPGFAVQRSVLLGSLAAEASSVGVEFRTSSKVTGVDRAGFLTFLDGSVASADLVVVADGANSTLRPPDLTDRIVACGDGCSRHIVERQESDGVGMLSEYWSGNLRVGVIPLSPAQTYVYTCGPSRDVDARRLPLDVTMWQASFPVLRDVFARVHERSSIEWFDFRETRVESWSSGSVVLVGDAAHAMSANLGQGGNRAIQNAVHLGSMVDPLRVEESLAAWEARCRPGTELAQRLSRWYGHAARSSGRGLERLRNAVVDGLMAMPPVERRFAIATGRAGV